MASMPKSLLATKLYIPSQRPRLVRRPQLTQRLQEGVEQRRRLTLISAPAGYGKTTLVVEWILQQRLPAAWISLDRGDNDFVRFCAYLVAALRSLHPDLPIDLLEEQQMIPRPSVEDLLIPLVNAVDAWQDKQPFLLVLDDYHQIQAQAVHEASAFLVEHLPPQAHMVIITRADPALPLSRWRGRGLLTELRLNDLRFNLDETAAYLQLALNLDLSSSELDMLIKRSEGWIAGLQMTAASLGEVEDVAIFLKALSGSQRHILDYLIEEVLQRQTEETQQFLIHTSILERLCASLCDAILGQEGTSQAVLESLEHANLFTIPLDDQRIWYRYHHLFADLLQTRLYQQTGEAGVVLLQQRASQWFEGQGLLSEAVEHALNAEDYPRASSLVAQAAHELILSGELVTFKNWIDKLPEEHIHSQPMLCVYKSWALLWDGSPIEMVEASMAEMLNTTPESPSLLPMQAMLALFRGKVNQAVELAGQALQQLPEEEVFLQTMATMTLASGSLMLEDSTLGQQIHNQAIRAGQSSGNRLLSVIMLCSLANQLHKEGHLRKAEEKYRQALVLATDSDGHWLPVAGRPLVGLGSIALERNQLELAETQLREGIQLSQSWGMVSAVTSYMFLAWAQYAQGKLSAAQESLDRAYRMACRFDLTELDDRAVEVTQARLWLLQNDLQKVYTWAERRGLWGIDAVEGLRAANFDDIRMRKYEYPVLARIYLSYGKSEEALALLDALLPHCRAANRAALVMEAQILRAEIYSSKKQVADACAALEEALALAEPEGILRIFLDEGDTFRALLSASISQLSDPKLVHFANELLSAFAFAAGDEQALDLLPEPISPRELEVLRLLATTSLSADQIAEKLFVSVHTVRSHIKSIYSKLGVHGRLEAADRARELHLV